MHTIITPGRSRAVALLMLTLSTAACLDQDEGVCDGEDCVGVSQKAELTLPIVRPSIPFVRPGGPCPTITSISPTTGSPGDSVSITLSKLSPYSLRTRYDWVRFGGPSGANANFTIVSATELRATVPSNARTGTIALGCYVYLTGRTTAVRSSQTFYVQAIQTGTLSLQDNSQYTVLSFQLDGQSQPIGTIPPGGALNLPQQLSSGSHPYVIGIGPVTQGALYSFSGSVNIFAGQRSNLYVPRLTVNQALTEGRSSRDYDGSYVSSSGGHTVRFRFYGNSTAFDYYHDDSLITSGHTVEVSWPNDAASIIFSVATNVANTTTTYPHASFYQQIIDVNGQLRTVLLVARN